MNMTAYDAATLELLNKELSAAVNKASKANLSFAYVHTALVTIAAFLMKETLQNIESKSKSAAEEQS